MATARTGMTRSQPSCRRRSPRSTMTAELPRPEGYRKAMRVMELAERAGLPVITFVDVPGAHPGPESEERGIAEAIARSIGLMSRLQTPIVAVITGEGGSGGALAIAVGD